MNYELFMKRCELFGEIPLKQAHEILEELFDKAVQFDSESRQYGDEIIQEKAALAEETLRKASDLVNSVLKEDVAVGDADDYHNFAMTLSRNDLLKQVVALLEMGLQHCSHSVDLLADYLQAVTNGATVKNDRAVEVFEELKKIPHDDWNWRAFKFSVDYLRLMKSQKIDDPNLDSQITQIIEEFKERKPDEPLAYVCEADFYRERDPRKAKEVLINADKAFGDKRLAQVRLKLADIYVEEGDFDNAIEVIDKCTIDALAPQPRINGSYVYLLSALCKAASFLKQYRNIQWSTVSDVEQQEIEQKGDVILRDYRYMLLSKDTKSGLQASIRKTMKIICDKANLDIRSYEPDEY